MTNEEADEDYIELLRTHHPVVKLRAALVMAYDLLLNQRRPDLVQESQIREALGVAVPTNDER